MLSDVPKDTSYCQRIRRCRGAGKGLGLRSRQPQLPNPMYRAM